MFLDRKTPYTSVLEARLPLAALLLIVSLSLVPAVAHGGEIVTGLGSGGAPQVAVFDSGTLSELSSFLAYGPSFTGGVRVAVGDVNGDGVPDIVTGSGPGSPAHVKVFDGASGSELRSFFAFDVSFTGGVYVAAGDLTGDGRADLIVGAGSGGAPHVKVFDAVTGSEIRSFFAYSALFSGGVRVAAGDVNGDGTVDIITGAGPGGGPHVKAFDGVTGAEIRSFFAYSPGFTGGVFVAAGDINNDGKADIVTGADAGGTPHVKVFDGSTLAELRSFLAESAGFTGGVRVAAGDLNEDGIADIVTATGADAPPHVSVFDGASGALKGSFLAGAPNFTGGVYVAATVFKPRTPPQRLEDLIATVEVDFPRSRDLLQSALGHLEASQTMPACNMLGAFINQVEAQSGKSLTVEQALEFNATAAHIRAELACR